jgi:hypothetical protein
MADFFVVVFQSHGAFSKDSGNTVAPGDAGPENPNEF